MASVDRRAQCGRFFIHEDASHGANPDAPSQDGPFASPPPGSLAPAPYCTADNTETS